ncbi:methyl-accepting chemotaxis protein [Halorhabdus salina]|uniref:methyl-accepting chemotaxis protein n=1 Tax=Halorhabdus salina TaxID=2750670 RepID=UPI0015EEB4AE|nr:methyl-accepting chemotaxis protein [Halorhabdus salina]
MPPTPIENNGASGDLAVRTVLNAMPIPAYILDSDHTVIHWSDGLELLLGLSREEMLGTNEYFGRDEDGNQIKVLANRVIEDPFEAEKQERTERVDSEYTDAPVYESVHWLENDAGEERYIRFNAMPIFEDGELSAVIQLCRDETDRQRRQEHTEALVEEVIDTMAALSEGSLGARASFRETDHVEGHLLDVLHQVNETASQLETLVEQVDNQAEALTESAGESASEASRITELVGNQAEDLDEAVTEMENFSARMEEVAANADEVATAAETSRETANRGLESGKKARVSANELAETGETLAQTVATLEERMSEIGTIVEIIQDVADQTNMLALNASIEAARAGEAGEGFEVVADEVKDLAEQTTRNAEEIATQIDDVETQTDRTVEEIERATDGIEATIEQVETARDAFTEIEREIEDVSTGINEIAAANDDQAAAIEEVTTMLETVRDRAQQARAASRSISEQTEQQRQSIERLAELVEELDSE